MKTCNKCNTAKTLQYEQLATDFKEINQFDVPS